MATSDSHSAPATLEIEKLVYGGDGLSRQAGRVVLTPFVLPGETVAADLSRAKNDLLRGALRHVAIASPERITPPCPYFQRCGGCHLQHASYLYQVDQKVAMLREVLWRVGRIEAPDEIGTIAGGPLGYRNRSQFHLREGRLGYLAAGSHTLVPIEHCPISSPNINEVIGTVREMQQDRRFPRFLREIEVFTDEVSVQLNVLETERPVAHGFFEWCREQIPGLVPGALEYAVAGRKYRVSYRSFFQVNRFLLEPLVHEALRFAEGNIAFDLYAGVGLFSVPLAGKIQRVIAVETGGSAARDLRANAPAEVETERASAEEFLSRTQETADFVLADPPRAGLQKAVVQELLRLRPAKLAVVSCDPATLARDLAKLLAGGYQITRLTMADLFPQTYHLETVTHLRLR